MLVRTFAFLALLSLVACGGRAESDAAGQGNAGSSTGGGGAGATSVDETARFYLDDALPWFDASGRGDFPDGLQDVVPHMNADGAPARATLSTHLPSDLLSVATALRFSARASQPVQLLVSVGHNQRTYDYFADTEAWPLATVEAGEPWQTFAIEIAKFVPLESEQDRALKGFYIAFIIDAPGPRELWFDRVSFDYGPP